MNPLFYTALLGLLACVCSGCQSIVTSKALQQQQAGVTPPNKTHSTGQKYWLPKGRVQVDITWPKDAAEWSVKLTPIILADKNHPFQLDYNTNALFDDDVTLTVDSATGLLQTTKVVAEDKTASSLADLISTVGGALTFGAGLHPTGKQLEDVKVYRAYHGSIGPGDVALTTKVLTPKDDGTGPKSSFTISISRESTTLSGDDAVAKEGIATRVPALYRVTIHDNTMETETTGQFVLPDESQTCYIPISRRALVKSTDSITLSNGMLQSVQRVRPSLVSAIIGLPKTLISALVPLPLQIRQSQTNNLQAIDNGLKASAEISKLKGE